MGASDKLPDPVHVEYHPVTGVPEEFHDYLHKDCDEFKALKGITAPAPAAELAGLTVSVRLSFCVPGP